MNINIVCPNCEEKLTVQFSEGAPTDQEIDFENNYADTIDAICAYAWSMMDE